MPDIIAKYGAGIIIQHSSGTPDIMQDNTEYRNVVEDIFINLKNKLDYAYEKGLKRVIIDPGIGFGKNEADNFKILNNIEEFYSLGCPVMVGVSRKSFLGIKNDNNDLKDSLSLALSYPLMQKGVDYLRVHNVKLHRTLIDSVQNYITQLGNLTY